MHRQFNKEVVMNKLVALLIFITPLVLSALTQQEAYRITSSLIDRYATSAEWADDIDSLSDDIEIEFTSPTSLFTCEISTNTSAGAVSPSERQLAFDQFLLDIPQKNKTEVSRKYEADAGYALMYCAETGYTNGLYAATSILARVEAPCRPVAYTVMRKLLRPSYEANAYVYSILTNQTFDARERYDLFNDYASQLKDNEGLEETVLTNGIAMLRLALPRTRARRRLDDLLVARVPTYVSSSNRLAYAQSVLGMEGIAPLQRDYFSGVTNTLLQSTSPLVQIDLP